jgi:hypothetical protein
MLFRRPARSAVAAVSVLALVAGCDSGESDTGDDTTGDAVEIPSVSVTIPPERLTPFCQAMIDLNDELNENTLNDSAGTDSRARIIEVYESVVDVVPPEIASDFAAVLANLRSGATTSATTAPVPASIVTNPVDPTDTTTPFVDEGYSPDESPTTRLAEYIRFACGSTENNPGPAATEPGAGAQVSEAP